MAGCLPGKLLLQLFSGKPIGGMPLLMHNGQNHDFIRVNTIEQTIREAADQAAADAGIHTGQRSGVPMIWRRAVSISLRKSCPRPGACFS